MYIIDTQFGKINFISGEISPVISTRIDANSAYYVIEVYEECGCVKLCNESRSDGEWHQYSHYQKLEIGEGISNSITYVQKDYLVIEIYVEADDTSDTPIAVLFPLGSGRYALNTPNGIACTLTGAHHYAGNITHPRQGFREMGVLEVYE